jgi:LCP family protein required for cell wall assembly
MKKQHSSIDGFIPRRSGGQLGDLHDEHKRPNLADVPNRKLIHTTGNDEMRIIGKEQPGLDIGRSELDDSLRDIDDGLAELPKKLSRKQRRLMKKLARKPRSKVRRIIKWLLIVILLAGLSVGGYMVYKFLSASHNILQGNVLDLFQTQPLKQDSNGRSNFLVLGTSEDDPGHPGSTLTDSMMVISVDQKNKDIYMFSIPRDLYVEYGTACDSGYSGKINVYFSCSDEGTDAQAEQNRLTRTQKLIGDIFGLDIQYGIHINQTVLRQAVDAVGGIDVDIQGSNGDSGVFDRNFDWRCNYTCYLVKYVNGVHHLDGAHALYLSQARGDIAPTYGLGNSNFDREKNQQKILMALKEKAMTTGVLTNLSSVTQLIDALGSNLRTNIQANEIRTLMQVASSIKSGDVHTISLVDDGSSVVKSGNYDGASVVMPAAGMYSYSEIQAYIKKNISTNPVVREAAPIVVLNGTGTAGFGQTKADELTAAGYNVALVDNAPDGTYGKVEVYQIGTEDSATAAKLASLYGVTIKTTTPPISVDNTIRFVVIFGSTAS